MFPYINMLYPVVFVGLIAQQTATSGFVSLNESVYIMYLTQHYIGKQELFDEMYYCSVDELIHTHTQNYGVIE